MSRRARSLLAALAVCVVAALVAWFAREPDVEPGVSASTSAKEPAATSVERKLASEALTVAASSESARVEAVPTPIAAPTIPPTMLIGRVVQPDGKPVVGARVRRGTEDELGLARLDPTATFKLGDRNLATPTDVEGRFVFSGVPADGEALVVGPERYEFLAEQTWKIARPGGECVLVMEPLMLGELRVEAVCVRADEPIAEFKAVASLLDRAGMPRRLVVEFAGREGVAAGNVQFLPGSNLEVALLVPAMAIGRGPSTVRVVQPLVGVGIVVRFELDPISEPIASGMRIVTGIVVERGTGAPIADANVTSMWMSDATWSDLNRRLNRDSADPDAERRPQRGHSVRTDVDGRFRIRIAASKSRLRVTAPLRQAVMEDVSEGADVRIELTRGTQVTVRVVTRDGKPAKPRYVTLEGIDPGSSARRFARSVQTNVEGVWTSGDIEPGHWEVRVGRPAPVPDAEGFVSLTQTVKDLESASTDDSILRTLDVELGVPAELVIEVDE